MNAEQRADAQQNGGHYTVNLRDQDDFWGEWFKTDICGTYDECLAEVHEHKLWKHHYIFAIVEA